MTFKRSMKTIWKKITEPKIIINNNIIFGEIDRKLKKIFDVQEKRRRR